MWDEPYGLVVAEAMCCGTPVIAFARGGIPELVVPESGRLVAPGDVAGMADAIPDAIQLSRDQARNHALRHCSSEAMLRAYLNLYRDMIEHCEGSHDRLLHSPPRLRHLARAMSICAQLRCPSTALSSLDIPAPHPFAATVKLPRDDQAEQAVEPTAHGALHWAPHRNSGFRARMDKFARWVADAQPAAVATDVSVEIATFARLLGVPVIVVALPGKRVDAPHVLAHRLADHIIAAWPR